MTESFTVPVTSDGPRAPSRSGDSREASAKTRKLRRILAGKRRYRCPIRSRPGERAAKRRRFRERSPPVNKKSIIARRVRAKIPTLIAGISPHTPNLRAGTRGCPRPIARPRRSHRARTVLPAFRARLLALTASQREERRPDRAPTIQLLERRGERREQTEATSFFSALLSVDGLRARKVSGARLERRGLTRPLSYARILVPCILMIPGDVLYDLVVLRATVSFLFFFPSFFLSLSSLFPEERWLVTNRTIHAPGFSVSSSVSPPRPPVRSFREDSFRNEPARRTGPVHD